MSELPVMTHRSTIMQAFGYASELKHPIADYSAGMRPAFRVGCHCRNCSWKGEARFAVGRRIPLWLRCPKCETSELSAHGDYLGRDELLEIEEHAAFAGTLAVVQDRAAQYHNAWR